MKNKRLIDSTLESLIDKFSQDDVVISIEKGYQSSLSAKNIDIKLIDDNEYLKEALVSDTVMEQIYKNVNENGLKSPLVLREKNKRFEIILGRKRLFAAKELGISKVPAVVIDVSDEEMILMLLADNRDRRSANVIETALLCKELCSQFGYSQTLLGKLTHQSRCQITNILRLLNLPKFVIDDISIGKLSYGHAKILASLPGNVVNEVVEKVYQYGLSVREVEQIARHYRDSSSNVEKEEKLLGKKYKARSTINKKSVNFVFDSEKDKEEFLQIILHLD